MIDVATAPAPSHDGILLTDSRPTVAMEVPHDTTQPHVEAALALPSHLSATVLLSAQASVTLGHPTGPAPFAEHAACDSWAVPLPSKSSSTRSHHLRSTGTTPRRGMKAMTSGMPQKVTANAQTHREGAARTAGLWSRSQKVPGCHLPSTSRISEDHRVRHARQVKAASPSERHARRGSSTVPPTAQPQFRLLTARYPVPAMPTELERTIEAYYLHRLFQLPVAHQELVIRAIALEEDCKTVLMTLKQLQLRLSLSHSMDYAARSSRFSPATDTAHPMPLDAPRTTRDKQNHRRTMSGRDLRTANSQRSAGSKETSAMMFFHQRFTMEACAAFLMDATELCEACRIRCYQAQPPLAKLHGIVFPEEALRPLYRNTVEVLLYRMTGRTQAEVKEFARIVVDILQRRMPMVESPSVAE